MKKLLILTTILITTFLSQLNAMQYNVIAPGTLPEKSTEYASPKIIVPVAYNPSTGSWSILFQHRALVFPPSFPSFSEWIPFECTIAEEFNRNTYGHYNLTQQNLINAPKVQPLQEGYNYYVFVPVPFIRGNTLYQSVLDAKKTMVAGHGNFPDNFAWFPENQLMVAEESQLFGYHHNERWIIDTAFLRMFKNAWPQVKSILNRQLEMPTFLRARHPRLGAESPAHMLPEHIYQEIYQYLQKP